MLQNWQIQDHIPELSSQSVHVWSVAFDELESRLQFFSAFLSVDEQAQAARFRMPEHRHKFILARGVLRYLLGQYLKIDPAALTFYYHAHGKPEAILPDGASAPVKFNLSHSGNLVLYAFMLHQEVGVDVEFMTREIECAEIAQRFFADSEWQALLQLPEAEQKELFFRIWSRKEAFIKATGQGLSYPLRNFVVGLEKGPGPCDLKVLQDGVCDGMLGPSSLTLALDPTYDRRLTQPTLALDPAQTRWHLFALDPTPGYAAALVVEGDKPSTILENFFNLII